MNRQLFVQAISRFFAGFLLTAILLFASAGTFAWPQAWRLILVLFAPMFIAGLIMMKTCPDLLKKRLNLKEEQKEQKQVILLSGCLFLTAFLLAGFNRRFAWIVLPDSVSWTAVFLFLAGYVLYAEVLRENRYLSRTVEVQQNQKVVDTGLYGIVRHPMYMCTLLLFLSMPLILGSLLSFLILLLYIPLIARRIRNEEKVLAEGLDGYKEYRNRVRYKVIPFLW